MRRALLVLVACLSLTTLPALGDTEEPNTPFKIVFDAKTDVLQHDKDASGKEGLFLTVSFGIERIKGRPGEPGVVYKVIIEEEGKEQARYTVPMNAVEGELAVVLSMDTSGSMKDFGRMVQAKGAATVFFSALPIKAEAGLNLFNHKVYESIKPPTPLVELMTKVNAAVPDGGTAYLDAAYDAINMVAARAGKQAAIVVMTDGVDLNSDKEQHDVIALAQQNKVKIYTIGIGKPGTQEPITTVLVLDKSGSMLAPANASEKVSKIAALKDAARRFVHTVGSNKRCAVLEFGDAPEMPSAFSNDRKQLKNLVSGIKASGETCLFDALYDAILTLEAEGKGGKRAIVAMTDGIDNKSRRRVEEVVQTAKEAGIRLYLLGFGQPGELDLDTMNQVAKATQGEFHHADSTAKLIQIFEKIADKIHDEGIDEVSLRKLAADTGGTYYPAADVDKLQFIVKQVAAEISDERKSFTFPSVRQVRDGLPREIKLRVIKEAGGRTEQVGGAQGGRANVRGVVIAQMDHFFYLIFLGLIGGLIALPALWKRKQAAA